MDPSIHTEFTSLGAEGSTTAYSSTHVSPHSPGFFVSATYVFFRVLCPAVVHLCSCTGNFHTLTKTLLSDFIGALLQRRIFLDSSPPGFGISTGSSVSAVGLQLQSPSSSLGANGYASSMRVSSRPSRSSKCPLTAQPSRRDVSLDGQIFHEFSTPPSAFVGQSCQQLLLWLLGLCMTILANFMPKFSARRFSSTRTTRGPTISPKRHARRERQPPSPLHQKAKLDRCWAQSLGRTKNTALDALSH